MDEALQHFNKAIELDLNNADIYLHRGQVCIINHKLDFLEIYFFKKYHIFKT